MQTMPPKTVAIIGAGPSGLVTAKTLLHDYPPGTFVPTIFEKRHEVGGLWPSKPEHDNGPAAGPVNPFMRTNLSRYTVAFSDLAWESVMGDSDAADAAAAGAPMFPQAWQVGRYLEKYTERFLPRGVVRLGERVVRTSRGDDNVEGRWTVEWTDTHGHDQAVKSEQFDFLVVASGYFSSPHIPDIPGLPEFANRTIHSSSLHNAKDIQHLLQEPETTTGKVVVIGGSMSGAEAASTLALHLSSTSNASSLQSRVNYQVHHICTRPFWTVPTYLPYEIPDPSSGEKKISFLPLDLVMYDLARRPPGPIEYALGPVSSQQVKKVNDYFSSLLGSDYEKYGKIKGHDEKTLQPPWVAIGNDYAEYVRSGTISTTIGRVSAVHTSSSESDSNLARIDITLPSDQTTTLDDVTAIVLATGFTPYNSLSYLPPSVLHTLEYSENDPFFPLILDGKGTTNAEIPDIGFVGFYRGPYWGVMEMQARLLAKNWADDTVAPSSEQESKLKKEKEKERQSIRDLRNADPHRSRGQFPMGDYIGLMETSARELGMVRTSLTNEANLNNEGERSGPVVPARYTYASEYPSMDRDVTLRSLRSILAPEQTETSTDTATCMAIFRAFHGRWRLTRTYNDNHQDRKTVHGSATFHPRYPTSQAYDKEYLYEESESELSPQLNEGQPIPKPATTTSIYRLQNNRTPKETTPRIVISSMEANTDPAQDPASNIPPISHRISPSTATQRVDDNDNEESISGGYTVHATGIAAAASSKGGCEYTYAFYFRGVAISSWERVAVTMGDGGYSVKTVYERG